MSDLTAAPASGSRKVLPAVVMILLAIVIVFARIQTYAEPLENDVAGYAVIAHEMLHGRWLYSDLWERKPPLLYGIFAAAELIVGPGRPAVFATNIVAALASLLAIYAAARVASGVAGGLFAAGLWTLLGGDLFLQANQPNAEALANPCITAAIAILFRRLKSRSIDSDGPWPAILIGLSFAAATLIKHHLIVSAGIMLFGYVLAGEREKLALRSRETAIALGTMALCWIGTTAYFAATGRLHVFVEILAGQNIAYAGNPLENLIASLSPSAMFTVPSAWITAPVLLVLGAVAFGDRSWRRKPLVVMSCAWMAAAWVAEALPGKLFPHYFQYWLPVWCFTGGVAAAALVASTRSIPVVMRYAIILFAFAFAAIRQGQMFRLTADQWADVKYPGGNYTQQKYLGRYLSQKLLLPGETFWVGGDDASLYFESGQSPPTGVLYVDPLIGGPSSPQYNRRLVADLSDHPPDLILLTPLIEKLPPDAPVFPWITRNYQRWESPLGGRVYHLYVRRRSALAHRVDVK